MKTKLYRQGAQVRCYHCGSPQVETICHHCGRPMCGDHGPVYPRLRWFTENREYTGLTLGQWPLKSREGVHCEYHIHSTLNYRRVVVAPGIAILLLGLLITMIATMGLHDCLQRRPFPTESSPAALAEVLRDNQVYGGLSFNRCYKPELDEKIIDFARSLIVTLFGSAAIVTGLVLNRENIAAEIVGRQTEVPFGLVSEEIKVEENLKAHITLDEGGKVTTKILGEVSGAIRPGFRFTSWDVRRLGEYRHKYRFDSGADLPFQAGFLLLGGKPRLYLDDHFEETVRHLKPIDTRYYPERSNLFWLEGEVGRYPFLTGVKGRSDSSWPRNWSYRIPLTCDDTHGIHYRLPLGDSRDWGGVPVRVLPLLIEIGNERRLRLQVQFNPHIFPFLGALSAIGKGAKEVMSDQVLFLEKVQVWVDPFTMGLPQSDGKISKVKRNVEGEQKDFVQVEWRGLWQPVEEGITIFRQRPEIRFDQVIPARGRLQGHLRLRVPALLSGIREVKYFSPLGYQVGDKNRATKPFPFHGVTYLDVEFDLALSWMPLFQVTTLSCTPLEFPGAPDAQRLASLLETLNTEPSIQTPAQHVYARRVVESVPQVGEQSDKFGRWHWDISGRRYHQTYPVDFHLVIYGQGDERRGSTRIDATVQSQIFDEESRGYLEATRDELEDLIIRALDNSQQEAGDKSS